MPRLRPLDPDEAPEGARPQLAAAERALGQPSISAGILARCPAILDASRGLAAAPARSGTLSAELRGLVCLRVAQLVTCPM
jgi:hypothetical protein